MRAFGFDPADPSRRAVEHVGETPDEKAAAVELDALRLMDQRAAPFEIGLAHRALEQAGEFGIAEVRLVVDRGGRVDVERGGEPRRAERAAGAERPIRARLAVEDGEIDLA